MIQRKHYHILPAILICFLFLLSYATLSIVRHLHFGSFGFDLGIADQIVWKYSQLKAPITTVQFYPFTSLLTDHVEFIYVLLAPFYWLYNSPLTLLFLQSICITASGIPVYLFARKKGVSQILSYAILVAYLCFYGIQNAVWFDVHSTTFSASFLPWFLYFLETKNNKYALLSFILTVACKEDAALLTVLVSGIYYVTTHHRIALLFAIVSTIYLVLVFFVYFPFFTADGYRYDNPNGLLASLNPEYLFDTAEKRSVYMYSIGWFGFLPLLSPLYLFPALGDIAHYFVVGQHLSAAHGLFMHYRVTLALFMAWPFIITVTKYKQLNTIFVAGYLLVVVCVLQYVLHVPLTYLTKSWFWKEPASVQHIKNVLKQLPANATAVAQNNITPHIAHRDEIFTLWPEKKEFQDESVCGEKTCQWFRWAGKPEYLVVDTSADWDIRHLLADREEFIKGVQLLEKNNYIKRKASSGNAVLYSVEKQPNAASNE